MESGKCLTLYAFYLYVACEQAVWSRSRVGKRASAERAFSQPLFPLNTYSKAGFKKGCPRHNYEHFSENVARKDPKVKEGLLFLEMYVLLSFKKKFRQISRRFSNILWTNVKSVYERLCLFCDICRELLKILPCCWSLPRKFLKLFYYKRTKH